MHSVIMKEEIWKEYKLAPDYSVSNKGRVKVKARVGKNGKKYKARTLKQTPDSYVYSMVLINRKPRAVHQLMAEVFLDHKPCGLEIVVDHKNNIPSDNRLENLQLITNRENLSKDKKGGTSKYVGVSWYKATNKWLAQIRINGKQKNLGYFTDELEASKAYQTALSNHLNKSL